MELDSPADAWYVWAGVAVLSVVVAGIAVAVPAEPPPDADRVANTVDRVAASSHGTSVQADHEADTVRFGTRTIGLDGDGGTARASVTFGPLTPVRAADGPTAHAARALLDGEPLEAVIDRHVAFENERELRTAFEAVRLTLDEQGAEWQHSAGPIRVRSVRIDGEQVVLIDG